MIGAELAKVILNPCTELEGKVEGRARYAVALGSFAAAAALTRILPDPGQALIYLIFTAAVVCSAWLGGVGPGLLCQVCSALFAFEFAVRRSVWAPVERSQVYGLLLFLVIGKLALFLTATLCWTRQLVRAEQSLRTIAATTNDCIWDWNLRTNRMRRSGNLFGIFGITEHVLEHDADWWRKRIHPDEEPKVTASVERVLAGRETLWEQEYRTVHDDGSWVLISDRGSVIRDDSGKAIRMIGGMSDITARRRVEERLVHNALHDALTGLPNRQHFRGGLERAMAMRSEQRRVAVLFVGIDRFKVVNDSLGHVIGDKLLGTISKRLAMSLRPNEMVARFGSDEFAVLVEGAKDTAEVVAVAERLQESIGYPYELDGHAFLMTASIGIAIAARESGAEELLRHADIAMYRAKSHGRARYEIFESSLDAPMMNVFQLESEFRAALNANDLRLYYQPIVEVSTGKLSGFEALVRWQHPTRGLLLPVEFLPLAEESGLIAQVGRRVIETACEDLRSWQKFAHRAGLSMSVNIAEKQITDPSFFGFVANTLEKDRLSGTQLILELTENTVLANNGFAEERLHQLTTLGIRLAIDDFGKGLSSLGRLQDLPFSIIKIDGTFVSRILDGKPEIVDAIIALAHQLKLEVTAECVETSEQFEHLKRSRCTTAQGLFFSGALTATAAEELLRSNRQWDDDSNRACA